jgi:hypothetical protein
MGAVDISISILTILLDTPVEVPVEPIETEVKPMCMEQDATLGATNTDAILKQTVNHSAQPVEEISGSKAPLEVDTAVSGIENKSITSPLDQTLSSKGTSLLTSPTIADSPLEDPIEAIDALEDAIEEMGKILPKVPLSPEKALRRKTPTTPVVTTGSKNASQLLASKTQRAAAKAPAAKPAVASKSTATKPKPSSSLLKTTQPSAVTRTTTLRTAQPTKTSSATSTAAKRQSMASSQKSDESKTSSKTVDYLASKRRPISMAFPPPPQRIKSTKAPTKSTFTLPGEAISARRKAEIEEKLRKEQEELQKKREFKARPAPSQGKVRPASMIVKQTASSRARLSVAEGMDGHAVARKENISPANTGIKRSNTVTAASRSGTTRVASTATKRMTLIESAAKASANTAVKRGSVYGKPTDTSIMASKRASVFAPRQSTSASTPVTRKPAATRPRSMMLLSSQAPPTGAKPTAEESLALRQKAKDIYNRDRHAKDAYEREKREKEEAAKKARLDAAEKGRQASREWAEKQKKRLAEAKLAQQLATATV